MPCDDCSRADDCPPCVNERCSHEAWEENGGWCTCTDCGYGWSLTEPPGPACSSSDEPQGMCRCGHGAAYHDAKYSDPQCRLCPEDGERVWRHAFVPAEPEGPTAAQEAALQELTDLRQETEAECTCGTPGLDFEGPQADCPTHGLPEPEAPEEPEHVCAPGATLYYCPIAGEVESSCHGGFDACCSAPEQHVQVDPPARRPPYAVAYALEGGAQYEIALPGDATVRFADGALIITHASAVLALTQARPMEGA